jgi:hypothetical protein
MHKQCAEKGFKSKRCKICATSYTAFHASVGPSHAQQPLHAHDVNDMSRNMLRNMSHNLLHVEYMYDE